MLFHATLVRVDPPGSVEPGEPIVVRSSLTAPTATDLQFLQVNSLSATAVLYVPLADDTPEIEAGAIVAVRQDGQSATQWQAVHAADHVGGAVRYRKVFVVPD